MVQTSTKFDLVVSTEDCSLSSPENQDTYMMPASSRKAEPETSVWLKGLFVSGQIFLGTLHVVLLHSSSRSHSSHQGEESKHETAGNEENDEQSTGYRYSAVLVILLSEVIKLVVSLLALGWTAAQNSDSFALVASQVETAMSFKRMLRFGIPAFVYAVENHIRFAVLKELSSPVTWVVFSHTEIPIVAVMTTVFLSRSLSTSQWISVVLLLDGVMASQVSICESKLGASCEHLSDFPLGALMMVLLSALMAATAGTATEYLFKEDFQCSIHLQNSQLYLFGILCNVAALLVQEQTRIQEGTLWVGFDSQVGAVLVTMAMQGLCVAAVVKHMSNVAKVYASAVGLFVAAIMSAVMADFDITLPFALAAVVVVSALFLYHLEPAVQKPAPGLMSGTRTPPLKSPRLSNSSSPTIPLHIPPPEMPTVNELHIHSQAEVLLHKTPPKSGPTVPIKRT